jgi:hypothetical protein
MDREKLADIVVSLCKEYNLSIMVNMEVDLSGNHFIGPPNPDNRIIKEKTDVSRVSCCKFQNKTII